MSSNPYRYDDDVDSDIFENMNSTTNSTEHKHTSDGTLCPECDVIHDFSQVPLEALAGLLDMLDHMPNFLANDILNFHTYENIQSKVLVAFLGYSNSIERLHTEMPIVRALFTLLDDITHGRATALATVYEIEQQLIGLHVAMKSANNALEQAHSISDSSDKAGNMVHTLDFTCQVMVDRLSSVADDYRTACAAYEVDINEEILLHGTVSNARDIALHSTYLSILERSI